MDRLGATTFTQHLTKTDLFQIKPDDAPIQERIELEYLRAQAIARAYKLTIDDILTMSDKFWALHMDNIIAVDAAPIALVTIQYNLAAGTLAPWAAKRPELRPVLQSIMDFECSAQFMVTEQAHGLDAIHCETTATMLPDGSFDFHTPHDGAAKYMPPSVPLSGINMPRVAIVIARLVVEGEDRGIRPFLVPLSDGKEMCKGVTSRQLPERAGAAPLGHSLTWFNHVRLHSSACLGSTDEPKSKKQAFQTSIWRVVVGSLSLGSLAVPMIGVSAYILARYSQRRTVYASDTGKLVPIISFRTQQIPILRALARTFVIQAFFQRKTSHAFAVFCDPKADPQVKMGVAAAAKCVMVPYIQDSCGELSWRIGAQGLSGYNQVIAMQMEMRGASIAEGDTLVLAIRLATELLLGRYELPAPHYPESLLARHEAGLIAEARKVLKSKLGAKHRSENFNRLFLPRCEAIVKAIGERFFYEAAVDAGVDPKIVDLYEISVLKHDPAWYAVHAGLGNWEVNEREDAAVTAAFPDLEKWLGLLHADDYAMAPIMTNERWWDFASTFLTFTGNASTEIVRSSPTARL
ncbi:hypothetical protein EXIGLDRAFT_732030 [Exidia glandulosa HHB12029]|uniref:Acyl-CoA dehydrogenase NM domain-like protein n=1 Tax=Exidia glandulosa HHB12029 TaxID=1314781 RepID=A0A165KVP3_EXIGL|nr:hypothetical protein EXIGLDRAFT_732030 [Exidia glandulosa HHB12029]